MKRLLIAFLILTMGQARADSFFIGVSVGLIGPGMVIGWESDQNFGVRLSAGTVWAQGAFVGGDVYGQWQSDRSRWYAGGGVSAVYISGSATYIAPEALLGFSYELARQSELFLELNPGYVVSRTPPLPADTFEYVPAVEAGLLLRINLGFRVRF